MISTYKGKISTFQSSRIKSPHYFDCQSFQPLSITQNSTKTSQSSQPHPPTLVRFSTFILFAVLYQVYSRCFCFATTIIHSPVCHSLIGDFEPGLSHYTENLLWNLDLQPPHNLYKVYRFLPKNYWGANKAGNETLDTVMAYSKLINRYSSIGEGGNILKIKRLVLWVCG